MLIDQSLFERLGGFKTLEKVHKVFYDKIYAHSWMKQYFAGKPQDILESQQTKFMTSIMGGPNAYAGKRPKYAHQHMYITEELFLLRQKMLSESIKECGVSDALKTEWINADNALKRSVVKKSYDDCELNNVHQEIMDFPNSGRN